MAAARDLVAADRALVAFVPAAAFLAVAAFVAAVAFLAAVSFAAGAAAFAAGAAGFTAGAAGFATGLRAAAVAAGLRAAAGFGAGALRAVAFAVLTAGLRAAGFAAGLRAAALAAGLRRGGLASGDTRSGLAGRGGLASGDTRSGLAGRGGLASGDTRSGLAGRGGLASGACPCLRRRDRRGRRLDRRHRPNCLRGRAADVPGRVDHASPNGARGIAGCRNRHGGNLRGQRGNILRRLAGLLRALGDLLATLRSLCSGELGESLGLRGTRGHQALLELAQLACGLPRHRRHGAARVTDQAGHRVDERVAGPSLLPRLVALCHRLLPSGRASPRADRQAASLPRSAS